MFVIVHNNQVILGPMPWRKLFFENIIQEDCEVEVILPQNNDGVYIVDDSISIIPARYTYDNINSVTQKHNGPFWTFSSDEAVGHFVTIDKDLDHVKSELKDLVANKRWEKENAGTKVTINGTEYSLDTSRSGRNVYSVSLQMNATSYDWKFKEGYATLTPTDLQNIVQTINEYVQGCFAEERTRIAEIESKTTLNDLNTLYGVYNPMVAPNVLQ